MDQEYYTPKEVRELLGMTYSGLQNQINTGNLHPVIPPGRKQKLYLKHEVDTLKAEREAWERSHHVELAAAVFGEGAFQMNALQGLMLVAPTTNARADLWNAQIFEIRGDEAVHVQSVTSREQLEAFLPGYKRIVRCQLLNEDDEISGIYQKQA